MTDFASIGIRVDTTQVNQATRDLNRLGQESGNTGRSVERLGASFKTAFAGLTAGLGLMELTRNLVRTVEQVQNLEVRLQSLTKSATDYANAVNYVNQLSKEHHKNNLDLQASFASLLTIEQTGIITRQQSQKILEGLSNVQSKTGATSDQLRQSMIGLSQALGMGQVQWEEIKQITEPMPGLLNAIANAVGFTGETAIGEFKKIVSEGGYTSKMLGEVLPKALESYSGAAEKTANNLTAKYNDIKNAWTDLAEALSTPVNNVLSPILDFVTWQLGEFVKQINYVKSLMPGGGSSAGGGGGDNGMAIGTYSLAGRPQPPTQAAANSGSFYANQAEQLKSATAIKQAWDWLEEADKQQVKEMQKNAATRESLMNRQAQAAEQAEKKRIDAIQKAMEAMEREIETEARVTQSAIESAQRRHEALTLSPRDQYSAELKRSGVSDGAIPGLMQSFDTDAGIEAQKKKNDQLKQSLDAYNQSLLTAKSSTSDLGAVTSAVFDSALGGVNALSGAFTSMVDALSANTKAIAENNLAKEQNQQLTATTADEIAKKAANEKVYTLEGIKLEQEKSMTALTGLRQVTGATSKMFDESSKGRKILHAMEMGFAAVEMAMKIKSLAVDAAKAVLNQGGGDPYSAFARMAAMGAIVGGIVAAAGGAFSSSGTAAKPISDSNGTGTVLGDPAAQSQSTNNIYNLLKDIHASEYAELRGINAGVNALNGGITNAVTKMFQGGGIKDPNINLKGGLTGMGSVLNTVAGWGLFPNIPVVGKLLNDISSFLWGGLFGKTTKTVTGGGISINPMQVGDYMSGSGLDRTNSAQYSLIEVKKKSWFSSSTHYDMYYQELNDKTEKALSDVFKSVGETMTSLADALGSGLADKVKNYIIPGLNIELRGLSNDDASKKLTGVISAELDNMASAIFGDIIGQYQKLGEGMAETAVRIVSQMAVVTDTLKRSGLYITDNIMEITNSLAEAAGGLEKFQQAFEKYWDKFATVNEKQNRLYSELSSALSDVGLTLPATIAGYRKLIESLDINNVKDQQRYTLLMGLADAADRYYQSIGNLEASIKSQASALLATYNQMLNEQKQLVATYTGLAKSIREYKQGLVYTNLSTGSPVDAFNRSKADFYKYANIIKGGKDTPGYADALSNIQNASNVYLQQASSFYASGKDFKRISETVNNILGQSVWGANGLAKEAKSQVDWLEEQTDSLKQIAGNTKETKDQLVDLVNTWGQLTFATDPTNYNPDFYAKVIEGLGNGETIARAIAKAFEEVIVPLVKEGNKHSAAMVKVAKEGHEKTIKKLDDIAAPTKDMARQARIKTGTNG